MIFSPNQLCKPPKDCSKIECLGDTIPTTDSNGCRACPKCVHKPKLCKPIYCEGILCKFGTKSQLTTLPNGCPGCRECVKCDRIKCPAIACINAVQTVQKDGCPGCFQCNGSFDARLNAESENW